MEGNKRLARKILDSVKVYERPELSAQRTIHDDHSVLSMGSNIKKKEPSLTSI